MFIPVILGTIRKERESEKVARYIIEEVKTSGIETELNRKGRESLFIPVILGTARKGRESEKVARYILEEIKTSGIETELIDVRDFRTEATDNSQVTPQAKNLSQMILRSDALIIISPEYNHGYPGELKMMLDMLYKQYFNKPVGFCGVSMGGLGGARVVEQLRQVAVELHMVPIREALYFPLVKELFDDMGFIKDKDAYKTRIKAFLDELSWYAKALKEAKK